MSALEMDPQIRARWVAALRSGEYKQGRDMLRTRDGALCCLGVLCELAVTDGLIPPPTMEDGDWVYGQCSTELPDAVMIWADLQRPNPEAPGGVTLAALNDGERDIREPWPFERIADVIEGVTRP